MKKYLIPAILLLAAGIVALCIVIHNAQPVELQLRTYRYGEANTIDTAYISIKEDNTFQFNYSLLSSYIAQGKYTVEGRQVYCKTDDGTFEYVFTMDGETLVFDKQKSSKLPEFSKIDVGAVFQ